MGCGPRVIELGRFVSSAHGVVLPERYAAQYVRHVDAYSSRGRVPRCVCRDDMVFKRRPDGV